MEAERHRARGRGRERGAVIAGAVISHGRLEAFVNDCVCGWNHFGISAYAIAPDPRTGVVGQTVCPRTGRVIDVVREPAR